MNNFKKKIFFVYITVDAMNNTYKDFIYNYFTYNINK